MSIMDNPTKIKPKYNYNKYCLVPYCTNNTYRTPGKIFISIPKINQAKKRKIWLRAIRRTDISQKTQGHVCEDHFNFEEDMVNHLKWKWMGGRLYLKENVVPHIFQWQQDRKKGSSSSKVRERYMKRVRRKLISDLLQKAETEPDEDTAVQENIHEFNQGQSVKASVSKVSPKKIGQNPSIVKRTTLSNSKSERYQSTDVNTSDVQATKRCFGKNDVASSKPTSSKRQPVKASNSKDSSINSPSSSVQNTQILERKSSSNRTIQQNQNTDEFDIFAKHIAFQLSQLPYYNAIHCQEKIKGIINQERFIGQQSCHQELETAIINQEPGLSEEEPLHPVLSQETIQAIIYHIPSPISSPLHVIKTENLSWETESVTSSIEPIEPGLSEEEPLHSVSGQLTTQTLKKKN